MPGHGVTMKVDPLLAGKNANFQGRNGGNKSRIDL